MPVRKDFQLKDDFYLWESLQGINNGRVQKDFDLVDNYYLYLQYLALFVGVTSLLTFRIPLTSAQIKILFSFPILAVPAPGVGKAIEVINASVKYTFIAPAYLTETDVYLQIDTAPIFNYQFFNQFLLSVASSFDFFGQTVNNQQTQMIENKALLVLCPTADPTAGNGTAVIYGAYRIITL